MRKITVFRWAGKERIKMNQCPCGSGRAYEACCGRYHRGETPPTAEALMRSRYSAFALGETGYLAATAREPGTEEEIRRSCDALAFLRLEVGETTGGGTEDDTGTVAFTVWFREGGKLGALRERSRFEREQGRWIYLDGDACWSGAEEVTGRNDPCPCGSGKKFKKCCG